MEVAGIASSFLPLDEFRDLATGNFNADGNIDIAISFGTEFVKILLGDGLGGFKDQGPITVGRIPVHIASADFNGDGALDLISLGNADGTFGSISAGAGTYISIPLDNEVNLYDMVVGNFDGNALPDTAFAENSVRIPGPVAGNGSVQIFLNPGQ